MTTTDFEIKTDNNSSVSRNRTVGRRLGSVRLHVALGFIGEGRCHTPLNLPPSQ